MHSWIRWGAEVGCLFVGVVVLALLTGCGFWAAMGWATVTCVIMWLANEIL